jgi:hypothetical protein
MNSMRSVVLKRWLAFLAIASCGVWGGESHALTIAEEGEARAVIVTAAEASPAVIHAADELARFLHEITGGDFSHCTGDREPGANLLVGPGAAKLADVEFTTKDLGTEGLVVRTVGNDLILAGGEPRGTLYAVYAFLEDVLGCRWYTPHAGVIPRASTLEIEPLDIIQRPSFEYREVFYSPAFDPDWAVRIKSNGQCQHHSLEEKHGGRVIYGTWCHTFGALIRDDEYLESHPEYFSLIDGTRVSSGQHTGQICLTNPDVLRIATDKVLSWIRESPEAKIWSVSQNDNDRGYCRCENCTAVAEEEGSQSGPILRFVNAIAETVAREHPEVLIDTLAYQYSLDPPRITKPHPNVRVRLCTISCCQLHPYPKCDHERNVRFMKALRGWSDITDQLYIWHYNTNFAHFLMPMPDLDELSEDIPMYRRMGVKGLFMQGGGNDHYEGRFGAGFMDELKTWLIAKMMWNADNNPRELIEEFLTGYYGKAGTPIGEYLDLLHAKVRKDNVHGMLCETPDWPYLSEDLLARANRCFDAAESAAESEEILSRVKHARLSIEYVEVLQGVRRALGLDRLPAQMTTPDYVRALREPPGTDPKIRAAEKAGALHRLETFIDRCEADGFTHFGEVPYTVRTYFEALAAPLRPPPDLEEP